VAGCVVLTLFVVGSVVWIALMGVGMAALSLVLTPEGGVSASLQTALGLSLATTIQTMGMLGIIVVICRLWGRSLADVFALGRAPRTLWVVAVVSGLAASLLSGWVAQSIADRWSWFERDHLDGLLLLMVHDPLPGRLALIFMVLVVAPVAEEVIFRGFVWKAVEEATTPTIAWLATSLMFAAYHVDPLQALSILPTGLFLGWLRLVSGSTRPAILCHFAHNALGVSLCLLAGGDFDEPLTPVTVVILLVVLLAGGICAQRLGSVQFFDRASSGSTPESSIEES